MVGEVLDVALLGTSVAPAREPVKQPNDPDDGHKAAKEDDRVGHDLILRDGEYQEKRSRPETEAGHEQRPRRSGIADGKPDDNGPRDDMCHVGHLVGQHSALPSFQS